MKILKQIISTSFLFLMFTGTTVAEPKNGFSLNGGYASHIESVMVVQELSAHQELV